MENNGIDLGSNFIRIARCQVSSVELIACLLDFYIETITCRSKFSSPTIWIHSKFNDLRWICTNVVTFRNIFRNWFAYRSKDQTERGFVGHLLLSMMAMATLQFPFLPRLACFSVTQLLGKIFHQAVVDAGLKENQEVVITIPSSYNNRERQAVMEAASWARLNVVQLLNESTAATISYGKVLYYDKDLYRKLPRFVPKARSYF